MTDLLQRAIDALMESDRDCDYPLIAELEASRAALSAPAGWQPISTAPKDGTVILVWPYLGRVDHDYWNERTGGGWLPGVTHWMPLPAAPSPQEPQT